MRGWRWLGSHGTAGILLGVLALICALGGTLPQSVRLEPEQLRGWQETWGGGWMDSLRLSDIFAAPWFWAVCALLFVSVWWGVHLPGVPLLYGRRPRHMPDCCFLSAAQRPARHSVSEHTWNWRRARCGRVTTVNW